MDSTALLAILTIHHVTLRRVTHRRVSRDYASRVVTLAPPSIGSRPETIDVA